MIKRKDYPKRLNIFGVNYRLVFLKNFCYRTGRMGECDFKAHCIAIDEDLDDYQTLGTLIHEIGHALLHESGIDQGISNAVDECIVESYSRTLVKLFDFQFKR